MNRAEKAKHRKQHRLAVKYVLQLIPESPLKNTELRKYIKDEYKKFIGCVSCGYNQHSCSLQLDHIDPSTKFRNKHGRIVHPAGMVYYSMLEMLEEYSKCRVMCANCHAVHTHTVQRESREARVERLALAA
jgi:hypothetical protein